MNGNEGRHLDPRAKMLWRIEAALSSIPFALFAAGSAWLLRGAGWAPGWIPVLIVALAGVWIAWNIGPGPSLRWRWWRYGIGESEVDLAHGWLTRTRTVIPIARIQHVDTTRGPVERRLGLATVVLYTAAGANVIPALADDEADVVRDRITAMAGVRQDL
jgi:uncharacterized protein